MFSTHRGAKEKGSIHLLRQTRFLCTVSAKYENTVRNID
jgi:hypothetical protein